MAAAAVLFQILACLGWGALLLAGLGLDRRLAAPERAAWSFSAGVGVVGWLAFWPGIAGLFTPAVLATLLAAGLPGLVRLRGDWPRPHLSWAAAGLAGLMILHLGFQGVQAQSPPVDADSLAYHYDLPKRFLEQGRIVFVPRAVDGAVPLLVQLTYAPMLGLGGEVALTLWAVATTWGAAAMLWAVARRWSGDCWAAAAALLFVGTPAVLYGGGNGQVEVRLALFATLGLAALGRWWQERDLRWLALAGLAAGLMMAGKFTGLLFATALGAVVLLRPRRLAAVPLFGLCALAAGGQWYGWNFVNSGDPVFPMLFGLLGPERVRFWTSEADVFFRQAFLATEMPLAHTLGNLLSYPLRATFAPLPAFESGRTGLGVAPMLLTPFAVVAAWRERGRLAASPVAAVVLAVVMFYGLWFFLGGSQRVRHLLPLLPVVMALAVAGAARWATAPGRRLLLAAGVAVVLVVQAGGGALAAQWFLGNWHGDRDAYYGATVGAYPVAAWSNRHLGPGDRLLNPYRDINYLLDVPFYHAHPVDQSLVDMSQRRLDPVRHWREIRALGITHIIAAPRIGDLSEAAEAEFHIPARALWLTARVLARQGCAEPVAQLSGWQTLSRTTRGTSYETSFTLLRLTPATCPYEAGHG